MLKSLVTTCNHGCKDGLMKDYFGKERDSDDEQNSLSSIDTTFLHKKIRNCCSSAVHHLD
jgi:hypothetical protein